MRPEERKRLLRVLREFANKVERLAEQSDAPTFSAYIERALRRVLEERITRIP